MSVQLDRECGKCGFKVKQSVVFKEENGRITLATWLSHCPFCRGFLKKPTPGEIRRALILNEMQKQ